MAMSILISIHVSTRWCVGGLPKVDSSHTCYAIVAIIFVPLFPGKIFLVLTLNIKVIILMEEWELDPRVLIVLDPLGLDV